MELIEKWDQLENLNMLRNIFRWNQNNVESRT